MNRCRRYDREALLIAALWAFLVGFAGGVFWGTAAQPSCVEVVIPTELRP